MFARLQTVAARPRTDNQHQLVQQVTDMISSHPGFAGLAMLEDAAGAGAMLTLWHTREDAELASERSRAARGTRPFILLSDDIYEVDDDVTGSASTQPAEAAFVGYFDGPLSPSRVAAARRGGRDRVRPVLQQVPSLIRTLVLWHPTDSKMAVVHLVTSADGLQDVANAITSTELLADEDPSLLTGPDRVHTHRVLSYLIPAPA
ncbi:MAG: hypothetical protein ACJ73S_25985 [Mycobacteriales bacterium]